jgi:hypothetical protein
MRIFKLFGASLLFLSLFSSCKKDDAEDIDAGVPSVTVDANGNVNLGTDAKGALYGVITKTYGGLGSTIIDENHFAYSWFEDQTNTKNAGNVSVNNEPLDYIQGFPWYTFFSGFDLILDNGNQMKWVVAGNAADNISGFTYTDNTPMPSAPGFQLPAKININNSYTINNAAPTGATGVIYGVIGDIKSLSKYVPNASTSYTFTSQELKSVAISNDVIGFTVMPVVLTNSVINGKKYYFVKQLQYQRETETL